MRRIFQHRFVKNTNQLKHGDVALPPELVAQRREDGQTVVGVHRHVHQAVHQRAEVTSTNKNTCYMPRQSHACWRAKQGRVKHCPLGRLDCLASMFHNFCTLDESLSAPREEDTRGLLFSEVVPRFSQARQRPAFKFENLTCKKK